MAGRLLRRRLKKGVSWLAVFAVALHVMLLGLAPMAAGGPIGIDQFSIICHSEAADDQGPASDSTLLAGHACDHCNLCSVVSVPAAPDGVLAATLAPARVLQSLEPSSTAKRDRLATHRPFARGPPAFT